MTIGQKIINQKLLSVAEAEIVFNDLETLKTKGVWSVPLWATELASFYEIAEAHLVIQQVAWEAIAKAYKLLAIISP